jgi:hypothetical protein
MHAFLAEDSRRPTLIGTWSVPAAWLSIADMTSHSVNGSSRPIPAGNENVSKLDQHYPMPRAELHRTFETIGLAA